MDWRDSQVPHAGAGAGLSAERDRSSTRVGPGSECVPRRAAGASAEGRQKRVPRHSDAAHGQGARTRAQESQAAGMHGSATRADSASRCGTAFYAVEERQVPLWPARAEGAARQGRRADGERLR